MRWRYILVPAAWVFATAPLIGLMLSLAAGFVLIVTVALPIEYLAIRRRERYNPDHDLLANTYKYDP